jgi:hypothetical protein
MDYVLHRLEPAIAELQRLVETHSRRVEELTRDQAESGVRMNELTMAVAEGIQHVDRAERRVKATVARARKQLEEHGLESPGLEAEWAEVRDGNGDGGEERGVQPVREEVGGDPSRAIALGDSFPGAWTEGDLPFLMGPG